MSENKTAKSITLVWFRQDLRLSDNPALTAALHQGQVVPVYVWETGTKRTDREPVGSASRWWLHHSLTALQKKLGGLIIESGDPTELIANLAKSFNVTSVYWNRCYEPLAIARDTKLKSKLSDLGFEVKSFNANLLAEPWEIKTQNDGPYQVYSPFWRALQKQLNVKVKPTPKLNLAKGVRGQGKTEIKALGFLPQSPDWAKGWDKLWQPGEDGAQERFTTFLNDELKGYKELRNRPDLPHVSRLAPHLHFGELSPRQIWLRIDQVIDQNPELETDARKFLSELAWREFSYHLLFHFPGLPEDNLKPEFNSYPWRRSSKDLRAWQQGQTGYPMVDAGMRELWQTGYMHNRVRMLTASFLIKHLRLDWRHGHHWFNDTLLDADLANNSASWQWVAGSGADAAPYFRIFNPILQGEKFDPHGVYVRKWVPELENMPDDYLHKPFEAPDEVLKSAGVTLGKTYPKPIVSHSAARTAALEGYDKVKAAKQ